MSRQHPSASANHALTQAREQIERTRFALHARTVDPRAAHTAVEGVHHVASGLAGLVAALMEKLPTMAAERDSDRATAAREVLEDLRAMHSCLTTGVLLLEPALEDLRGLAAPAISNPTTDPSREEPMTPHEAAEGDWADQQITVEIDGTTPSENLTPEITPEMAAPEIGLEVDPADVTEQQRTVPTESPCRG